MKRIAWDEMILGLDRLLLGAGIDSYQTAEQHAAVIDAYLEASGWSWDMILQEMLNEQAPKISAETYN